MGGGALCQASSELCRPLQLLQDPRWQPWVWDPGNGLWAPDIQSLNQGDEQGGCGRSLQRVPGRLGRLEARRCQPGVYLRSSHLHTAHSL